MNIFVVDTCPQVSAQSLCDKHISKMAVESTQMLVSAMRRHGATDADVPLTKSGTPHKGGYAHHPCTVWAGDSASNFMWLYDHAIWLCVEFEERYGKSHACYAQLMHIGTKGQIERNPIRDCTPVALAVGEELQQAVGATHLPMSEAVDVYREFYWRDKARFAKWEKGRPAPDWWEANLRQDLTMAV